jgi:hypothetical protein
MISDETRLPVGSKISDRELSPRATYVSGVVKKEEEEEESEATREEEEELEECIGDDPGDDSGEDFSLDSVNINEASNLAVEDSALSGEMS